MTRVHAVCHDVVVLIAIHGEHGTRLHAGGPDAVVGRVVSHTSPSTLVAASPCAGLHTDWLAAMHHLSAGAVHRSRDGAGLYVGSLATGRFTGVEMPLCYPSAASRPPSGGSPGCMLAASVVGTVHIYVRVS
jgi:hypothetical protein